MGPRALMHGTKVWKTAVTEWAWWNNIAMGAPEVGKDLRQQPVTW